MSDPTRSEPIDDPQELERQLVVRENAGDVRGMTALFEADAVIELNDGRVVRGKEAIHEFFTELQSDRVGAGRTKVQARGAAPSAHLRRSGPHVDPQPRR